MFGPTTQHDQQALTEGYRTPERLLAIGPRMPGFGSWEWIGADLPLLMKEADLLVFPTVAEEALGRSAVEAMASGLPVVASRIGGLPFTVQDGLTGLHFDPGDAGDLARQIESLLDDPHLRERMGIAGRQRFEEHFTWDAVIERHYRPLLTRRAVQSAG